MQTVFGHIYMLFCSAPSNFGDSDDSLLNLNELMVQ